jgi:hypothetical protein
MEETTPNETNDTIETNETNEAIETIGTSMGESHAPQFEAILDEEMEVALSLSELRDASGFISRVSSIPLLNNGMRSISRIYDKTKESSVIVRVSLLPYLQSHLLLSCPLGLPLGTVTPLTTSCLSPSLLSNPACLTTRVEFQGS